MDGEIEQTGLGTDRTSAASWHQDGGVALDAMCDAVDLHDATTGLGDEEYLDRVVHVLVDPGASVELHQVRVQLFADCRPHDAVGTDDADVTEVLDHHRICIVASHPQTVANSSPRRPPARETDPMRIDKISTGEHPPDDINVIVEVPVGGEPIKYELDKDSGTLFVDRFLYTPMRYPGNYGFVPHTLSDDGDPIDVLVCNTRVIVPGAVVNCRPIGVLVMEDDGGEDEKILAVPSSRLTQRYTSVENFTDLPSITKDQIEHFFAHYKDLEPDKWVRISHWGDAAEAKQMIVAAIERDADHTARRSDAPGGRRASD